MKFPFILLAILFHFCLVTFANDLCLEKTMGLVKKAGLTAHLREFTALRASIEKLNDDLAAQSMLETAEQSKFLELTAALGVPELTREHLRQVSERHQIRSEENSNLETKPLEEEVITPARPEFVVSPYASYLNRHYYGVKNPSHGVLLKEERLPLEPNEGFQNLVELPSSQISVAGETSVTFLEKNPSGIYKTKTEVDGPLKGILTGLSTGMVIATGSDRNVFLLNDKGVQAKWTNPENASFAAAPIEVPGGTVIVGNYAGALYHLKPKGSTFQTIDRTQTGKSILSILPISNSISGFQFAVVSDGVALMEVGLDGSLRVVNKVNTPNYIQDVFAISDRGIVFYGSHDKALVSTSLTSLGNSEPRSLPLNRFAAYAPTIIGSNALLVPEENTSAVTLIYFDPDTGAFKNKYQLKMPVPEGKAHNFPISSPVALGNRGFAVLTTHGLVQFKKLERGYKLESFLPMKLNNPSLSRAKDGSLIITADEVFLRVETGQKEQGSSPAKQPTK